MKATAKRPVPPRRTTARQSLLSPGTMTAGGRKQHGVLFLAEDYLAYREMAAASRYSFAEWCRQCIEAAVAHGLAPGRDRPAKPRRVGQHDKAR